MKVSNARTLNVMRGLVLINYNRGAVAAYSCTLPFSNHRLRVVDILSPPACTGLSHTYL